MAKRLIDTGLFDDPWFMDLSQEGKLLWIYAITKCDHAGIIKINTRLIKTQTEIDNIDKVLEKEIGERFFHIKNDTYFLDKFIEYQYPGFPNTNNKVHKSIISILEKHKLFHNGKINYGSIIIGPKDKDKEIDKDKKKDKKKEKMRRTKFPDGSLSVDRKPPDTFKPPTIKNVISYFEEKGFDEELAQLAFEYYDDMNWVDSKGNVIRNWKLKMNQVWMKNNDKKKKTPRSTMKYPKPDIKS